MKLNKAAFAIILSVILITISVTSVLSETATPSSQEPLVSDNATQENSVAADNSSEKNVEVYGYNYDQYLKDHEGALYPKANFVLDNLKTTLKNASLEANFEGKENVIAAKNNSSVKYEFDVQEEGFYSISVNYNTLGDSINREYKYSLMINDEVPFDATKFMVFTKLWEDIKDESTGEFFKDSRGNDLTPRQREVTSWQERYIEDLEGYYTEPFSFYLNKGANTITFNFTAGEIALAQVELKEFIKLPTYDEYIKQNSDKKVISGDEFIVLEAEQSYLKSDPVMNPKFDRSSSATSPQHAANLILNTIGQQNWKYKGQWISWKTVDVPEAGMYKIVMRARQNYVRGVRVSRKISINGEVPFKEAETYYLPFSNRWYIDTMSSNGQEYLVYLNQGENTIAMEVTPSYPSIVRKLQDNILKLNSTYRSIIMITGVGSSGNAIDEFRDHNLDKEIPLFLETLNNHLTDLKELRQEMTNLGFEKGGEVVVVEDIIRQISSFIDDTDTIPTRLKMFKDNISAASSWMLRLKEQPLELDWIAFAGQGATIPPAENGFFKNLFFSAQTFWASFFNDYTTLDDGLTGDEVIEVWVGLSKEQTELIKRLIDDYFIPTYNVRVNVNLVQQGLIPATLTGKGPDVAMFITPSDIINLAARNALVPLQDNSNFDDVTQRFQDTSMTPYTYMKKVYALPISEGFMMMYYRKDVFQELGITPPKTWTEFYDLILVLQRNNLTIGVPGDETTFQTLVFQHGGKYYKTDEWKETDFDSPEVLAAFKQWTDFYSKYSLPVVYDFYSRFRTGEMPLGIAPYVMYNQLSIAAPEIKGLWEMVPIPGVEQPDGSINNANTGIVGGLVTGGGLTGMTMFNKTKNKDGAWELMKWWTSAEIQARYGREIETIMGPAARFDTANLEAFKQLPWTEAEKTQLLSQWGKIQMIQQTPVNYYIARDLVNAFRRVVINGENHRETLNYYNRDINKEIIRKQIEFGLVD